MKPLILKFAETSPQNHHDCTLIEYSKVENLSVVKGTRMPAIALVNLETETFTKTTGEASDSDNDFRESMTLLLDTQTGTRTLDEPDDSDSDYWALANLVDTETTTKSVDTTTDSDA